MKREGYICTGELQDGFMQRVDSMQALEGLKRGKRIPKNTYISRERDGEKEEKELKLKRQKSEENRNKRNHTCRYNYVTERSAFPCA